MAEPDAGKPDLILCLQRSQGLSRKPYLFGVRPPKIPEKTLEMYSFLSFDEGPRSAVLACPSCASDTVYILAQIHWSVVVDDRRDVRNVDPSRDEIGTDQPDLGWFSCTIQSVGGLKK